MQDHSPMTRQVNELKVIVLGDSESGKSLLISRFFNGGKIPVAAESWDAAGISIHSMDFSWEDQAFRANFWGFGGQAIRNSLHQVFLTQRAIYVIVVNVRDDSQEERARFWLDTVKMTAPSAPVVLVLNKIDLNPNSPINAVDLQSRYPNLREIVRVSATQFDQQQFYSTFGSALLRQIFAEAENLPRQPESWYRLKDELRKRDFAHLSIHEFFTLCKKHGLSSHYENIIQLLQWLSDSGVIFLLKDLHTEIIQPEWLMQALSRVPRISIEDSQNGIIPFAKLHRLLGDLHEDYDHVGILADIMREFQLSIPLGDSLEFLPMLCSRNTRPVAWEYQEADDALECRVDYDYLPCSVIHRLMARFHAELDMDNVWYSGARFILGVHKASALVQSEGNSLVIYIRCDNALRPSDYLQQILGELEAIETKFRLQPRDRKVVYKQGGLRDMFSYDMLMGLVKSGKTTIYSAIFGRMISIYNILKQPDARKHAVLNDLLNDLTRACISVQSFYGAARRTEDDLTAVIRNDLWARGYLIADHRLLGLPSWTTKHDGDVDLLLLDEDRQPMAMIEAMRMPGSIHSGLRHWEDTLSKLLMQSAGIDTELPFVSMINYVECPRSQYSEAWHIFRDHILHFAPERMVLSKTIGNEELYIPSVTPFIHIARSDYEFRGRTITVYQFFAWVEPASEQEASDGPQKHSPTPFVPESVPALPEQEEEPQKPAPADAPPDADNELARKEYRVVFLGDSEAGKSLLLSRVLDPKHGLETFDGKTTPGIVIKHQFHTFDGVRVRVNFWDFGGQEILHSLHRMFLSLDTLYVIVLNTRNDNHDAQADFWMRYVQAYAYGAPVLFVLNKIDQNPKARLNLPVLNRHFSTNYQEQDILRICGITKDQDEFRREFTNKLLERIAAAARNISAFSEQEAVIRAAVEEAKKTERVIKTDQFRNICEEAGLYVPEDGKKDPQENLMERFHRAGILVFFKTGLKMLLDPQWITKAIYKLLEKQDTIAANGFVPHKMLETLCRKELGDSEYARFILDVMRSYGLSFQYDPHSSEGAESGDLEFIPMLCRQEEPSQIHDMTLLENTIVMEMHFEYLPTGVLYQLMVTFADHLDPELVWRSGVRFKFGALVSAIVRRDANVMQLYIHYETDGVRNRALKHMEQLMDEISTIAERGKATARLLEIKLGYMVGTIQEFFDYRQLLHAKASRVHYVASTIREKHKIRVLDILAQEDGQEARRVRAMLELCLKCCQDLQGTQTYWFRHKGAAKDKSAPKMGEDQRTQFIKAMFSESFNVSDQTQWGSSASGISSGELDLKIDTKDGDSLAILEALNITGDNKDSRKSWREHLTRMMNCYNPNGLRHLLLISYLDCDKKWVGKVQDAYLQLLSTYKVPNYDAPEEVELDVLPNCPNEIHVVRANYYTDTGMVSVYHFLVHIPRYTG